MDGRSPGNPGTPWLNSLTPQYAQPWSPLAAVTPSHPVFSPMPSMSPATMIGSESPWSPRAGMMSPGPASPMYLGASSPGPTYSPSYELCCYAGSTVFTGFL